MCGKKILEKLKAGKCVFGTQVMSTSPMLMAELPKMNLDFAFLDTEHIPMDREVVSWMCYSFSAIGIAPIMRITSPNTYLACQALDGGAEGVITPYIESEEQVRMMVGAMEYRPLKGERLRQTMNGEYHINAETQSFLKQDRWSGNKLFLVNIESEPAIENLDSILSVPGLDGVMIGPQDLSISLGVPEEYRSRKYDEAVGKIATKVKEKGLYCGVHLTVDTEQAIHFIRDYGMQIILQSNDIQAFAEYITHKLDTIRKGIE